MDISLMANDGKHIFMYLFVISSLLMLYVFCTSAQMLKKKNPLRKGKKIQVLEADSISMNTTSSAIC